MLEKVYLKEKFLESKMMLEGKTSVITGCNRAIGLAPLKILLKMAQIFLHVAERFG